MVEVHNTVTDSRVVPEKIENLGRFRKSSIESKEFWECRAQTSDGKPCLKPFDNPRKMITHFHRSHEVQEKIDIDFFRRDDLPHYFVKISEEGFKKSKKIYEKSLFCSYCRKQFDQRWSFNMHNNIHTNGEFKCSICNAPFVKSARVDISRTYQI